jgi:hypothetical protein
MSGSPETHRARIVDAYKSLIENEWSTELNIKRLREVWPILVTKADKEAKYVVIHPRHSTPSVTLKIRSELCCNDPTEIELRALLVIQNFQTFPQLTIEVTNLSTTLQKQLGAFQKSFPNVVFDFPNPDQPSHVIII